MTDNEIIKALECCMKTEFISDCAKCEMLAFDCKDTLIENALNLINRQKAEIEKLHNSVLANAEVVKTLINELKTKKPASLKEFVEELEYFVLNEDIEVVEPKCKDYESYINGANQFRHQIKNGINSLVKEGQR